MQIHEAGSTSVSSPISANNNHTYVLRLMKERKKETKSKKGEIRREEGGREETCGPRAAVKGREGGRCEKSWMYITSTVPCLH